MFSWSSSRRRLLMHFRVQASRGSPAYMAPELFDQDGATHSTASDFWAFGCMLYQCFCGRAPFINTSFHDLVRNILHDDPAPMPNASPEFADLVGRLLDKNPATRITWVEMLTHPFWQFTLTPLPMPEEPSLLLYIEHPSPTVRRPTTAALSFWEAKGCFAAPSSDAWVGSLCLRPAF
jgi:serine/threonine protein kinase